MAKTQEDENLHFNSTTSDTVYLKYTELLYDVVWRRVEHTACFQRIDGEAVPSSETMEMEGFGTRAGGIPIYTIKYANGESCRCVFNEETFF